MNVNKLRIGMIGAGFLAETRARCYTKVSGYQVEIVAVAARTKESARNYARRHQIDHVFTNYRDLLAMPDIDVVDLCVPNNLHRAMTEEAARAGKHIICTKPLTAYVGQDLPENTPENLISHVDRRQMRAVAEEDAQAMNDAAVKAGVFLMYGENWIYAPSIQKALSLIKKSKGTILEMRGGERHKGSHSPFSKKWCHTGGGALLRMGAHPIGAMLYLKQIEGIERDRKPIRPLAVSAEVGDLSQIKSVKENNDVWISTGWEDVENWATVIITFTDGSKAVVHASDIVLGGMESHLQILLSNAHIKCNLSPNNLLEAYAPHAQVFGDEYIIEKTDTSAGWSTPMPDEDWTAGHLAMCQDFIEAVAENRPPLADGQLGLEVIRTIYAAYSAAAEGNKVYLEK